MSEQLSSVVIPAPQGAAHRAGIAVAELTGQPGHTGRASLAVVPGQGLPCAVQLGPPGGAVRGELALQGAVADGQAAGHRAKRGGPVPDRLGQDLPEMFRPGRHRRRRQGCRVAGQDLGQGRVCAAQRQVQVGGTEGEGGYRRAEFDPAGAQRLDERPLRARGRLGEGYADRDDRLARGEVTNA
jgi:hypothetical protein